MIKFEKIPSELKVQARWVLWKYEEREGARTKVPYQVNGQKASTASALTWTSFERVKEAYENGGFDGIGFVLGGGFVGIDLDHSLKEGTITQEAEEILDLLQSYSEVSPSGAGLHIICRGEFPETGRRKGDLEVYAQGRFFTVTGNRLQEYPATVESRSDKLAELYDQYFAALTRGTTADSGLTDEDVIALASRAANGDKFIRLMEGNTAGYSSQSEADEALCCILAFYTKNAVQIERIWSKSKLSGREKFQREDYRQRTIQSALDKVTEAYQGSREPKSEEMTEDDLKKVKIAENPRFKTCLEPDNFIQEYIRWGETVSDGYPDYWFGSALFCVAVAVNRNARMKLRQGEFFTNVWVNEIGLSSLSRKSTNVNKAEEAIVSANIDLECKMPDDFSPEAMIERLDLHPRSFLIKDESAGLLAAMKKDYMRGMKDCLMQLFDCKEVNRQLRTSRHRGDKTSFHVKDPYLNMMLATTPSSFAANTELLDVTSGWLARFLHFYPNHPKSRWLPLEEGTTENDVLAIGIHARLIKIRQEFYDLPVARTMHLSKDAAAYYKEWQRIRERELVETKDDRRAIFYSRLAVYVIKFGMLFTIGRADYREGLEISLDHIKEATRLVDEYFMPMALIVADLVGKSAEKNLMDRILAVLTSRGGKMTKRELMKAVHQKKKDLSDALESLVESGEIRVAAVSNRRGPQTEWIILTPDIENRNIVYNVPNVYSGILSHPSACGFEDVDLRGDSCDIWDNSDIIDKSGSMTGQSIA